MRPATLDPTGRHLSADDIGVARNRVVTRGRTVRCARPRRSRYPGPVALRSASPPRAHASAASGAPDPAARQRYAGQAATSQTETSPPRLITPSRQQPASQTPWSSALPRRFRTCANACGVGLQREETDPACPRASSASDAHVRRRLRRRGTRCRHMHRSTRGNTSTKFEITRRVGGIRGADRIHRPNGECVKPAVIEGADWHLSRLRREGLGEGPAIGSFHRHCVFRDGRAAIR